MNQTRSWWVLAVGLSCLALGVLAGAVPLTGVEPSGLTFVDCGPAVFGRPDPLPHPSCATAYNALPEATWGAICLGAIMLVLGMATVLKARQKNDAGTLNG